MAIEACQDWTEGSLELGVGNVEGEVVYRAADFFERIEENRCLAKAPLYSSAHVMEM